MKILLVTETLKVGGAESFVLRLATELLERGHDCRIFCMNGDLVDQAFVESLAPTALVITGPRRWSPIVRKLDAVAARVCLDLFIVRLANFLSLTLLLRKFQPHVIHSHLIPADAIALDLSKRSGIPAVTTMHGDYIPAGSPDRGRLRKAEKRLLDMAGVVCISQSQFLELALNQPALATSLKQIYNGFRRPRLAFEQQRILSLGIEPDAFVFGMVSRGKALKGWEVAINAFRALRSDAHLILVGEGADLSELENRYGREPGIHFIGGTSHPTSWIEIFDVGLLPSRFPTESLPTVIIEYLACGKPCIATDLGEIPRMLGQDGVSGGTLIPYADPSVMTECLERAMRRYLDQPELLAEHHLGAMTLFENFDMDRCVDAYVTLFEDVTGRSGKFDSDHLSL